MKTTEDAPLAATTPMAMLAKNAEASKKLLHEGDNRFLPRFKIVHPMEDSIPELHHQAVIAKGGNNEKVEAPYRIATLQVRKGVRENYVDEKGRDSSRMFFADGNSHEGYLIAKGKVTKDRTCKFKEGRSYLVAIIQNNAATIASFDLFGGSLWYWQNVLAKADVYSEGAIVEVKLDNHKPNYQPEFKGWDSKKLGQFCKQFEATKEEIALINDAGNAVGDAIQRWLER